MITPITPVYLKIKNKTYHSFDHYKFWSQARTGRVDLHNPDVKYHSIDTVDYFTGHVGGRGKMENKADETQQVVDKFQPLNKTIPVTDL